MGAINIIIDGVSFCKRRSLISYHRADDGNAASYLSRREPAPELQIVRTMLRLRLFAHRCCRQHVPTATPSMGTVRWNWVGVRTKYFDKASGTYKYREWDEIIQQCTDPVNGKGENLLHRHTENERHVKRKDVRRMNKDRVEYERKVRQIDELTNYIKFVRDHREDFAEDRPNEKEVDKTYK